MIKLVKGSFIDDAGLPPFEYVLSLIAEPEEDDKSLTLSLVPSRPEIESKRILLIWVAGCLAGLLKELKESFLFFPYV